jgi:hypothetical protein
MYFCSHGLNCHFCLVWYSFSGFCEEKKIGKAGLALGVTVGNDQSFHGASLQLQIYNFLTTLQTMKLAKIGSY